MSNNVDISKLNLSDEDRKFFDTWLTKYLGKGFDGLLGTQILELGPDKAVAKLDITPNLHQPTKVVHGGVYCAFVETIGSFAGTAWLYSKGIKNAICLGVNNNTDFFKSISEGHMIGTATPLHRGKSSQVWEVRIEDPEGKLLSRGQLRLHNSYY